MNLVWKPLTAILLIIIFFTGCQTTYYAVWEKMGKEKRHLLRENIQQARSEQEKAARQFKDVLSRIKELYGFQGGDLEKFYNKLNGEYEDCKERSESVSERIEEVEQIASDLFREWEKESNKISNTKLKSQSKASLEQTKERYARLRQAMTQAESSTKPVLKNLQDYVLYLKHNLNAQAMGALKQEADQIESEVDSLISDITRSVREAEDFLRSFQ